MNIKFILLLTAGYCLILLPHAFAQKGLNEFEKTRIPGNLDNAHSENILKELAGTDSTAFTTLKTVLSSHLLTVDPSSGTVQNDLNNISTAVKNLFDAIDKGENAAVILIYRTIKIKNGANSSFDADFASLNTKIYHKQAYGDALSNYLLATKKVYFIFLDLSDQYFLDNTTDNDKKLSNTTIKIVLKKSFFKQNAEALGTIIPQFMSGATDAPNTLKVIIVEIDPKSNKSPCDIVLSNKSFKEDVTFTVHDKNFAEFQVGVVNNKFAVNNFSISAGDLAVTPHPAAKATWKSTLYATIGFNSPRELDTFRPRAKVCCGHNTHPDGFPGRQAQLQRCRFVEDEMEDTSLCIRGRIAHILQGQSLAGHQLQPRRPNKIFVDRVRLSTSLLAVRVAFI